LYCSAATTSEGTASSGVARLPRTKTVPCSPRLGRSIAPAPSRWSSRASSAMGTALTPVSPGARAGAPVRTGPSTPVGCGRSARVKTVCGACASTIAPRSSPAIASISAAERPPTYTGRPSSTPAVEGVHASA
jgi:hypothetical protein